MGEKQKLPWVSDPSKCTCAVSSVAWVTQTVSSGLLSSCKEQQTQHRHNTDTTQTAITYDSAGERPRCDSLGQKRRDPHTRNNSVKANNNTRGSDSAILIKQGDNQNMYCFLFE